MIEKDFRQPRQDELQEGAPIWLLGKSFLDTLSIGRRPTPFGTSYLWPFPYRKGSVQKSDRTTS